MKSTLMLTEAPPEMRSRLMGVVTVCIGTGPLGQLAAGGLSDGLGPRGAVIAMAAVGLVLTGQWYWLCAESQYRPRDYGP